MRNENDIKMTQDWKNTAGFYTKKGCERKGKAA